MQNNNLTNKENDFKQESTIKDFFQTFSLNLNQLLLLILVLCSTCVYTKIYILDLKYQPDMSFEQFLLFGFSNLFYAFAYVVFLYIPFEFFIFFDKDIKGKFIKSFAVFLTLYLAFIVVLLFTYSINTVSKFIIFCAIYYATIIIFITFKYLLKLTSKKDLFLLRLFYIIISIVIFLNTDFSTLRAAGLGNNIATLVVKQDSFIKDIVDIKASNHQYIKKGDHILLQNIKVLSNVGKKIYIQMCQDNLNLSDNTSKCSNYLMVEFDKKEAYLIKNKPNTNTK